MTNNDMEFDRVRDGEYSDTVRALIMAWDSKDESLLNSIAESSLAPLLEQELGIHKIITAFVSYSHSVSYALAATLDVQVSDVISMDANADYRVQSMILDGDLPSS